MSIQSLIEKLEDRDCLDAADLEGVDPNTLLYFMSITAGGEVLSLSYNTENPWTEEDALYRTEEVRQELSKDDSGDKTLAPPDLGWEIGAVPVSHLL